MEKVKVDLGARSYPIYIGLDLLDKLGVLVREHSRAPKALIISNGNVYGLYGQRVRQSLEDAGFLTSVALIGDGEEYKNLESAAYLYDQAVENKLDRQSVIIALGGGVIGDIAGFVAATFMRGIPFVQVPTTLLAQVDSSVGGKVAVNHPRGKNLIGAFYQPQMVVADLRTLATLPEREIKTGLAEVVKYGVIWDQEFFEFLESNAAAIWLLDQGTLLHIVKRSCEIKAAVVGQDEEEKGIRAILNFGHTFGHALEALTEYKEYRHGEAVAIGMVQATQLAQALGILAPGVLDRIINLLKELRLPAQGRKFDPDSVIAQMAYDKKVQEGKLHFVLPLEIGRVKISSDVPSSLIRESLKAGV